MIRQFAYPGALILFAFLLLFLFTKILGPIPFAIDQVTTNKTDLFTISGEGRVPVKPDIAVVNFGVEANAKTVQEAQTQINSISNKIVQELKKLGIDEKDIQTQNYNIYPNYDNPVQPISSQRELTKDTIELVPPLKPDSKISGYRANSNLVIKIRKIDNINAAIDTATRNGGNQIGGITFDISDRSKAENEARQKAVAEAKKKAEQAALIAGFKLGKIVNYSENFNIPFGQGLRAAEVGMDKADTQIEPGSLDVVVNITLSYEIH